MSKFSRYYTILIGFLSFLSISIGAADCPHCDGHDCLATRQAVLERGGGASGKWIDAVTPKRNWKCTEVEDLGAPDQQCEMCEREYVRFVHRMKHGNFGTLDVGCICAGYMDGSIDTMRAIERNIEIAQGRQGALENRLQRRRNFPTLKGWKKSKKGNPYIKKDGQIITIFPKKNRDEELTGGYGVTISQAEESGVGGSRGNSVFLPEERGEEYPTVNDAKLGAFDFLFPRIIRFDD